METLFQTKVTTKILHYLQYKIAQKFSAGENILTLLPSTDVATCFCLLEQTDISTTPKYLNHKRIFINFKLLNFNQEHISWPPSPPTFTSI